MAYIYISEYRGVQAGPNGEPIQAGAEPSITTQKVAFTTATASAAFNAATNLVRIICDAEAHLSFGTAPTATASHLNIQPNSPEYFIVVPGQKVSAYDGSS